MHISPFTAIYFLYGLAFFSMGLLVAMEGGRSSDRRLRTALRPLAGFGLVHAAHEWLEMLDLLINGSTHTEPIFATVELALMAFSFISLAAFGSFLLLGVESTWRISLIIPLALETIWVFGLLHFKSIYPVSAIFGVADVWTRYSIAIPAGLLAGLGLIVQQRIFRRAGLVRFGQDSLWAAVCFGWYSLVGQLFPRASLLPPSTFLNEDVFLQLFGFPIQLLRAASAIGVAIFVVRFLYAFQVEADRQLAELQTARLQEAEQRETLRGELFRRVVAAQESERQRIARDLHDETGQSLTAIGLGLRGLFDHLGPRSSASRETLRRLQTLTTDSLKELQRIISDLRPSHLDDLGLSAALRWYASKLQTLAPLDIKVNISGEEAALDEAVKITAFRIVQEALTNAVKHASAQKVGIELHFHESYLHIFVRDDGAGFDLEEVRTRRANRPSLGLAGMEERAALIGGHFQIRSRPGYGTEIEVVIPYRLAGSEEKYEHTTIVGG